jgi:quinol monooxygenase YgiN
MILVVARVTVKPGMEDAYEALCARLMPMVREAEPGVLFYHAAKSRDEDRTYRVVEAYRDKAAMDEHIASRFVQDPRVELAACFETIDIRIHDAIA